MKLKIGDILLYKDGNSYIANMIKKETNSIYNHAGLYIGDNFVAQALDNGFTITEDIDVSSYSGIDVYRLKENVTINKKVLQKIVYSMVGTKYGFLDLIKIWVYLHTGRKLFAKRSKALICSEAVALVYHSYGIILFPNVKNLDYVTPEDFAKNKFLYKVS